MQQGWARILTLFSALVGLVALSWLWPSTPRLYLAELRGPASVLRAGEEAPVEATQGARLQSQDHVTTADGAEAVLQFGDSTQIRVGPASSVEVAGVDESGLSLEIAGGSVRAIVRPDSGQVRIGNRGRGVVARDATVDVGVTDEILQVRAVEGDVQLEGVDRERLAEGEEAVVQGRNARVGTVPSSLLLSVAEPEVRRTAAREHLVQGRTAPAAEVVLQGPGQTRRVRADAEGRFAVPWRLAEGENPLVIEAIDVFGVTALATAVLPVRDTQGPEVTGDVEYPR